MSVGGLTYRTSLPRSSRREPVPRVEISDTSDPPIPFGSHAPLQEIESAHVSKLVDSSSEALLKELEQKRRQARSWPIVGGSFLLLVASAALAGAPFSVVGTLTLIAVMALIWASTHDALAKSVVVFYDFDQTLEEAYEELLQALGDLGSCAGLWRIEASGQVYDPKYHAGADQLIQRSRTFSRRAAPPYVETNIETAVLLAGKKALYFFPDRILIYEADGVGAVGYRDLEIDVYPQRFIEDGAVPRDTEIVGRTWQYVNKSGGPDRRFNNNRELPICRYEDVLFSSASGLQEIVQVSRHGCGSDLKRAIERLGREIPRI